MNNYQNDLIKKIGHQAVLNDWEKAFGGKSYGNRHLFRVNKIAKYLLKREKGDPFIVLVGAWIHDVALASGDDYDQKKVEKETTMFLDTFTEINDNDRKRIVECAIAHETNGKKLSTEAAIVHDADALDKCGALGIIRHIWKTTNLLENRVLKGNKDFTVLKRHLLLRQMNLLTKTAQWLVKDINEKGNVFFENRAKAVSEMENISSLAMAGKTTDQIVKKILLRQKDPWTLALRDQVSCKYLAN
ncbi:MAG: hypothetical protein UW41_C0013G0006 [Candidatus Collierbacteria bacterium GW2011_GWC2_44_18]|uniref:HD domain-containing protein n=1 Tax=Candidatus Collierbacteria bacterium GW2011_GWC2_44_18 TaxID=1618392 RepID=A0A0G1HPZ5_9BACT|nr:MAG: hypothetical protein UW16_C0008G0012 [Microgenomates group bacterium GW2011_GWC1_44_10]KKT49015.1 MAG: hypothetical protein UW41_C0013G0006 [Candidatus Collierbacteria bacterium GW2011_GWC2_44_18]